MVLLIAWFLKDDILIVNTLSVRKCELILIKNSVFALIIEAPPSSGKGMLKGQLICI